MACEVDLDRRHGDAASPDGIEIRTRTAVLLCARWPHPIDGPTPGVRALHHRLRAMPVAEARGFYTLHGLPGLVRHVHVEDGVRWQGMRPQALYQIADET